MWPSDDWLVEWMERDASGHHKAAARRRRPPPPLRHHQIYPIHRMPRRRRRRRQCHLSVDSLVNENKMSHLIEPNDHDRYRSKSKHSSLMALVLCFLLATPSVAGLNAFSLPSLESSEPNRLNSNDQQTGRSQNAADAYRPLREQEICPSMDIRNSPDNLTELRGCRVVEGFVHIVLMGQNETRLDFSNHTYPLLREITGYLVFYRVQGLRSIGQLFPNLTVIRGQQLFFDFSLVVFELMQLTEIGLRSLTMIQRGSVFIERNPNLCYVDTIDWARIAHSGRFDLKIRDNSNQCPARCPNHCPSGGDGRRLCWNSDHCQKVCDKCDGGNGACRLLSHWTGGTSKEQLSQQPPARQAETECCHSECAGSCTGPHAGQCDVCRNVIHEGECRSSCPPGFYLYMKRRCVKDFECVSMPPPRELLASGHKDLHWKFWEDECILDCPTGYREQNVTYNETMSYKTCVRCEGTCHKVCPGGQLNSIETVQRFRGCTTIDGNLEVTIKGGDSIVKELERSLGDVVEIRGYLKISRSFPLVSLGFLRNLRNITEPSPGKASIGHNHEYGLIVQDNQNLQQLWPKNHRIAIKKKLMFHFNPQLCMNLIDELRTMNLPDNHTGPVPNAPDTDISPWSNGDKAACAEEVLSLKVVGRRDKVLLLTWTNFRANLTDKRHLLGYIISYIEAPYQNVSYYDGRNACGGDGWVVVDVAANPNSNQQAESQIITQLKPYTQYAIYVQTYTVAPQATGKRVGARSPIIYDRTLPADPDPPENLRAIATSSSELVIEWDPPTNPNGVVTHYRVRGFWGQDDQEYVDTLDSCADQSYSLETKGKADREEAALTSADNRTSMFGSSGVSDASGSGDDQNSKSGAKCECSGETRNQVSLQEKEKEQHFRIEFENFLHNKIYVRNPSSPRSKRSVDEVAAGNSIQDVGNDFPANVNEYPAQTPNEFPRNFNASEEVESFENRTNALHRDRLVEFNEKVRGTSYTVTGLRHYTQYNIQVYACQDPDPQRTKRTCSKTSALTSARTKQNDFADEIPAPVTVLELNHTSSSAKILWPEPIDPNGLVIKYQIEYRRTDMPNSKTKRECVRRKEYTDSNMTRVLFDLTPGNYCVQVRAFSLSGPGPLTRDTCFVIEDVRSSLSTGAVVGVLVLILIVILASAGAVSYYYRRKNNGIFSNNPDYHAYIPDGWEVERNDVKLVRELGKGSFGMVYEGVLHKTVSGGAEAIKCAVKTVNERATIPERMQFLNEANVMKEFNAHHVVKLLGVVSKGQPTFVIMELMANGDLNSYLRSHRPNSEEYVEGRQPPTLKCVLKMAIEIADGMAYLADKKFVHRDLAARNCMVAEDLTVKIGDFGMTRDIYETDYYRKDGQGLLPVRWMAPESIRDGVFTSQSDVWSYGVVLWEMATLSSRPYQGLANEQVLKYVVEGGVMERPEGCPDRLFNLMEMCWRFQSKHRPTFIDIIDDLLPDVPATFASVSFYHSDAGVGARAALKAHHEHDHRLLNDPTTPLRGMMADCGDIELDAFNDMDSVVSSRPLPIGYRKPVHNDEALDADEETPLRTKDVEDGLEEAKGAVVPLAEEELDGEEDVSKYGEGGGDDDHVAVLYPYDRRAYILVKSPGGNSANGANGGTGGSKSDSSKAPTTTSVTSEDSKGSYVSNGSASNGYVMGILKQRRHNAEC